MNLLSHSHNPTAGGFHRLGDAGWNAFSGGRGYSPRRGSPLGWPERRSARNSIIKKVSSEMRGISTGGDSQRAQAQFGEIPKPTAWPGREKNVFGAVPEAVFANPAIQRIRSASAPARRRMRFSLFARRFQEHSAVISTSAWGSSGWPAVPRRSQQNQPWGMSLRGMGWALNSTGAPNRRAPSILSL